MFADDVDSSTPSPVAGSHHPRVKRRAAAGVQQCRSGEAATISLAGERLNVKWVAGVGEVDLVEGNLGTLARLTVAGSVSSKRSSLGRSLTPSQALSGSQGGQAENLAQDMADLMHDFDTVSR